MRKLYCLALSLCLLLSLAACGPAATAIPDLTTRRPAATPEITPAPLGLEGLAAAADYAAVYAALTAAPRAISGALRTDMDMEAETGLVDMAPMAAPEPAPDADSAPAGAYSQTNIQVAGVDEGDIVKTDGAYLYVLRGGELLIFRAAGAETQAVFRATVGEDAYTELPAEAGTYTGSTSRSRQPEELYVSGDRLAVVYNYSRWMDVYDPAAETWRYESESRTEAELYDVSDPAAPVLLTTVGQDGSYQSSRLAGDALYLLSNDWAAEEPAADAPETYVPCLYREGVGTPVTCDCIWIPEECPDSSYTVATAFALSDGGVRGSVSLLGGSSTAYMDGSDLYLARQLSGLTVSQPRTESVYTVTEYNYRAETAITRVSLAGGGLTVAANGTVDGRLLNQFAMDAYDGHLRVVTTSEGYSYTVYEDVERGFVNHVWPEEQPVNTNSLFVLDGDLKTVGSVTGLGEDERVYSVRFDGETGYFVTFRETDPLFAVDLHDPTAPKVLSALKIPGFSQYLHVYGQGRLLGLGMDADEETGRTGGMKLSMFDTGDPADVTEKHTLLLDAGWSEALYNHRAILIAPEKDIIAFPAENSYMIYGYSDVRGFYLRAEIQNAQANGWWHDNARGLYIGQYAYVVADSQIWVMDLEQLSLTATIDF